MNRVATSFGVVGLLALAACGGTATPEGTFDDRVDRFVELIEDIDTSQDSVLPISGQVSYKGKVGLAYEDDTLAAIRDGLGNGDDDENEIAALAAGLDAFGRARLSADFTALSLEGTFDDFVDQNDDRIKGELVVSEAPFTRIAALFPTDVAGEVDGQTIDGQILNRFTGDNGEILVGEGGRLGDGAGVDFVIVYATSATD